MTDPNQPKGGWRWRNPRSMRGLAVLLLLALIVVLFLFGGPQLRTDG